MVVAPQNAARHEGEGAEGADGDQVDEAVERGEERDHGCESTSVSALQARAKQFRQIFTALCMILSCGNTEFRIQGTDNSKGTRSIVN